MFTENISTFDPCRAHLGKGTSVTGSVQKAYLKIFARYFTVIGDFKIASA